MRKITGRERELGRRLRDGLAAVGGVTVLGESTDEGLHHICSISVEGVDPTEICKALDRDYRIMSRPGLQCAPAAHKYLGTFPAGTARFSLGYFNTPQEVDLVIEAVEEIARRLQKGDE